MSLQQHLCLLQVSKYRSMNVSTMTDARVHSNYVIQTGEVPVHHTHEEYMDVSAPPALRLAALIMPVATVPKHMMTKPTGGCAVKVMYMLCPADEDDTTICRP